MSQEKVYEEINLNSIKIKLLEFIKKKSEDMEQLS